MSLGAKVESVRQCLFVDGLHRRCERVPQPEPSVYCIVHKRHEVAAPEPVPLLVPMVVCVFEGYDGDSPNLNTCRRCGKEREAHYTAEAGSPMPIPMPMLVESVTNTRMCSFIYPDCAPPHNVCRHLTMTHDFPYCHDHRKAIHDLGFYPPEPLTQVPDPVNHPPHYQGNGLEVIDVVEAFELGFNLGNAAKYILRAGKKGDRTEDLRKAIWYIEREIAKAEKDPS